MRGSVVVIGTRNKQPYFSLNKDKKTKLIYLDRFAAAAGIAASCGTLALVVLMRLNRNVDYEPVTTTMADVTLLCPRCGKKQQIPLGQAECSGCRLRIRMQIEEPRCAHCGYLLYGLTSDRFPECGTAIGPVPAG